MSLLDIENLAIEYETSDGRLQAVAGIDMSLAGNEILGLVGESGCGKTTVAKAIQGILPANASITSGRIRFDGTDMTAIDDREYNALRWDEIAVIPQSAMNALDPVYQVKDQFWEIHKYNTDLTKRESTERSRSLLQDVGLDDDRLYSYPHELSGGQRQRVVIALALALNPSLVIADEPTTGLDVIVQDEILDLIKRLQADIGNSMIFITHDINVVAELADRVSVMYAGQVIENGPVREVFDRSAHPYTIGLRNAFPTLDKPEKELISIPGSPPDLISPPDGCRFRERCPFSTKECRKEPALEDVAEDHHAKCHYVSRAGEFRSEGSESSTWQ